MLYITDKVVAAGRLVDVITVALVMLYITDKVVAAGRLVDVITVALVVDMFSVVATEFGGARNSQKKWHTIVQEIRNSS